MTTGGLPIPAFHACSAFTLLVGDPRRLLAKMRPESVHCVVATPPGYRPGEYSPAEQDEHEATPRAYVDRLRTVFRETHRVLAADGTLWLVLGDTCQPGPAPFSHRSPGPCDTVTPPHDRHRRDRPRSGSLLGIPWRVAFALQDDGWILRNAIVWHRRNVTPWALQGRLPSDHEYVFLLVKQPRYWFGLDAIREPLRRPDVAAHPPPVGGRRGAAGCTGASARRRPGQAADSPKYRPAAPEFRGRPHGTNIHPTGRHHDAAHARGRNPGDVWDIPAAAQSPRPLAAHPAARLALRCIAAGCRPGGTVLDPFGQAAATGVAALHLGRRYVGVVTNPACHEHARQHLAQVSRRYPPQASSPQPRGEEK
jgi:DNA modification methylase